MKTYDQVNSIQDVLNYKAIVTLERPVSGFWDGGAKSRFEFTPEIERTPGKPAIRWGSWGANLWFVVEFKSAKQHFAALRRKLRGNPARRIKIEALPAPVS